MKVYEDSIIYLAELIAGFDLEKRDRILENYSDYEITRAAISKQKYG